LLVIRKDLLYYACVRVVCNTYSAILNHQGNTPGGTQESWQPFQSQISKNGCCTTNFVAAQQFFIRDFTKQHKSDLQEAEKSYRNNHNMMLTNPGSERNRMFSKLRNTTKGNQNGDASGATARTKTQDIPSTQNTHEESAKHAIGASNCSLKAITSRNQGSKLDHNRRQSFNLSRFLSGGHSKPVHTTTTRRYTSSEQQKSIDSRVNNILHGYEDRAVCPTPSLLSFGLLAHLSPRKICGNAVKRTKNEGTPIILDESRAREEMLFDIPSSQTRRSLTRLAATTQTSRKEPPESVCNRHEGKHIPVPAGVEEKEIFVNFPAKSRCKNRKSLPPFQSTIGMAVGWHSYSHLSDDDEDHLRPVVRTIPRRCSTGGNNWARMLVFDAFRSRQDLLGAEFNKAPAHWYVKPEEKFLKSPSQDDHNDEDDDDKKEEEDFVRPSNWGDHNEDDSDDRYDDFVKPANWIEYNSDEDDKDQDQEEEDFIKPANWIDHDNEDSSVSSDEETVMAANSVHRHETENIAQ